MKLQVETMIDSLLVEDDAKDILRTVVRLANSDNESVRNSVPSLLVVAQLGCGFSCFGRVYSRILDESPILQVRGSSTFVDLVFPKDNLQDEKLFFASPQRAASITNRFYGTMLISLEEYSGQDLIKSSSFQALLNFIELNRNNIHFVFRILPEFSAKKQLKAKLSEYINIVEGVLEQPDCDKGYTYVLRGLKELGYSIEPNMHEYFKDKIISEVVAKREFARYRFLNNLVERINYEAVVSGVKENRVLDKEIIDRFMSKYKAETENITEVDQVGFRV